MKYSILIILSLVLSLNTFSQTVTLDSCNFESLCPILIIDTLSTNLWEIGTPSKTIFDSAYSATNALITDSINTYPINNHSSFTITLIDTNYSLSEFIIEFQMKIDTDSLIDGGYIDMSYDGGINWYDFFNQPSSTLSHVTTNLFDTGDTLFNGKNGVSGTISDWKESNLYMRLYTPLQVVADSLMIRFNFISDSINTNKEGWMIDDLKLSLIVPYDNINENENTAIHIYPSPSRDQINIELKEITNFQNTSIQLIDNLGKVVLNQTILQQKSQLSIDHLPQGFYHVLFIQDNTIIGQSKVIKE